MSENIKERISALADGELSEFEVRRVLRNQKQSRLKRVLETNTNYKVRIK